MSLAMPGECSAAEAARSLAALDEQIATLQAQQYLLIRRLDALGGGRPRAGIAKEVALACRISPLSAQGRLVLAERLAGPLYPLFERLAAGRITVSHVLAVHEETSGYDDAVAAGVAERVGELAEHLAPGQLRVRARRAVAILAPDALAERRAAALAARGLSWRIFEDGTGYLGGVGPSERVAAAVAVLKGHAARASDGRSRAHRRPVRVHPRP